MSLHRDCTFGISNKLCKLGKSKRCWNWKFFPDLNLPLATVIKIEKDENLMRQFCIAPLGSALSEHYFSIAREDVSGALRCCVRCPSGDLRMRSAPLRGYKLRRCSFSVIPLQDVVFNESLPHRRISSISLRIERF